MDEPAPRSFLERLGLHRPELRAWAAYDWANSAFATTIMAAVLPIYYVDVAAATEPDHLRTAYWAYTQSAALLAVALASPVLGAIADYMGAKKRFLAAFMGMGALGTVMLWFVGEGDWLFGSLLFAVGFFGFGAANVFYDGLLPHVASEEEQDRVSTAGFAIGYLGGGLLLALNLWWILSPATFGFADAGVATRWAFVSVGAWWAVFTVPLLVTVREPPARLDPDEVVHMRPVKVGFTRVLETLGEIRQRRQAFMFLLAFWIYNDGVGTIIKMGAAYGAELDIDRTVLIATILVIQFVGIPFAFLFGALGDRIGTRNGIYLALAIYTVIAGFGYFMSEAWHFVLLGGLIATAQGGVQGLSRSMFASLIPRGRSSEFFGFFSVSEKIAGVLGPLIFGVVAAMAGTSRLAILSLVVFFVVGAAVLSLVDVEEGRRAAREEDRRMREAAA
ncbi:MAG: MFS transporter [Gemmatimonadetes bacterium]|nr:MFS transporter [Gemmatimonadota bacterium]